MKLENEEYFGGTGCKCTNDNIYLFIKYMRGQLLRTEERELDRHIQSCQDCLFNFAYVEDIIRGKQPLSIDEKTLLLKYSCDPIWQYGIEKAKKEILEEVKLLIKNSNASNSSSSKNLVSDTSNNNKHSNQATNPKPHSPLPIYRKQSFFIATIFIVLFFSLTLLNYLIFTRSTNPLTSLSNSITNITSINKTLDQDLYQELDTAIDEYLFSKNRSHLEKAEKIAKELKDQYQENYGVDLVKYYQSVPLSEVENLLACRKEMFRLINLPVGDNFAEKLKLSQKIEKELLEFGNNIEAYRVKTITNKLQLFNYNYDIFKSITQEGLKFSKDNNYLFLQGYFLLWQAKGLSETASFEVSEKAFQQTIAIGKKIHLDDLVTSSNMSLATLYHLNNDDKKCLETAQDSLSNPKKLKKYHIVQLMQIAGLAASNLKYPNLSNQYLKDSASLAEEIKNPAYAARSYMFLSLTLAESGNYLDSEQYHLKATQAANELNDNTSRLNLSYIISGYYGKTKLLEGNFSEAAKAYTQSLTIIKGLGLNNNLALSQINEGLALASKELKHYKEADQYVATANYYSKLAENNMEKTNCLLSFVPNPCYLK